jgi:hypothetical protein
VKLAIIFEVPDGPAEAFADMAARMIKHHQFAEQQGIKHWSFDQEMRPVAAVLADRALSAAARDAINTIDQEHPWIPGTVFADDERLKPALLAFLGMLTSD